LIWSVSTIAIVVVPEQSLMTTPGGEKRSFKDMTEVALWATANALGGKSLKEEG
jgi:hypothetical protein